jgi:hypothetical protein
MDAPRLDTPVALFIFNRPDTTRRVFSEIARARPRRLLVVGDGPRAGRPGEADKVAEARAVVDRVDWDCEVATNFSPANLGCRERMSSGIDWVFTRAEEAIFLEDDCLPDPTFFRYCQELLQRYRGDRRIGMVSGDNFQFGRRRTASSYYFSRNCHIWGWATWRDRWVGSYDVAMARWPEIRDAGRLPSLVADPRELAYWRRIFDRVHAGRIDAWDFQWVFANWLEGRVSITPAVNLISNIGFGRDATHPQAMSEVANLPRLPMAFPMTHPRDVVAHAEADAWEFRKCFAVPLWKRIRNRLVSTLAPPGG